MKPVHKYINFFFLKVYVGMERVKLDTAAVCSLCLQEWGIKKWRALLCLQICQKGQRPQATKADESTCTEVKVVRRLHQNNTVYRGEEGGGGLSTR